MIKQSKISAEFIDKAIAAYNAYKSDKSEFNERICQNERWYRKWYEVNKNGEYDGTSLTAATAFVFSAIENKYADAMDNYPHPKILEREPADRKTAQLLSRIIPVQLDISKFKKCYKQNWRKKLKYGTAVYGVFYNREKEDIEIMPLNILGIYCDMNVRDVQESRFLFVTSALDNDMLKRRYPDFAHLFEGDASIETYGGHAIARERTEVVDCYYKKGDGSVHLMKLVRNTVIEASEDMPGYEKGLYAHGKYPVVFDCLYQSDDSPFGFGITDVIRNPQMYIDRLDGIILKNAALSGKQRWLVRDKGAINEEEFKDWSRDVIHVDGSLDEAHIRPFQAQSMSDFIMAHRREKIAELKEVIGNRDFQQGSTTNGVTAASAISVLQQSGEKLSRAMIDDSFDVYSEVVSLCIELIRQFYTKERVYRITNDSEHYEFVTFSNKDMRRENNVDCLGFSENKKYKNAEFDIEIIPERQSPSSREANNQTILELWKSGLLTNTAPEIAETVLESMSFDGKERITEKLKQLKMNEGGKNYGLFDRPQGEEQAIYADRFGREQGRQSGDEQHGLGQFENRI